jgi:hypothetical protein
MGKIAQIINCNKKVRHVIVQFGLTEDEAFLVESALIDMVNHMLPDTLTNLVSGHGAAENFIDAEDLMKDFSAQPIQCKNECLLLIKIEKRWADLLGIYGGANQIPPQEIYNATRAAWKINVQRANSAKYILSIASGLVRAVYCDVEWVNSKVDPGRKEFNANIVTNSNYHDKSVAHLFKRGAQLPIRYICCD